jgi:hypothetical protein
VSRFGFTGQRADLDAMSPMVSIQDERPVTPLAGETMHEIAIIIALHLAFAFVVVLTLQAFGVS